MPHDWYPPFEPPWGVAVHKTPGKYDRSRDMQRLDAWNNDEKIFLDETGSHRNLYVYCPCGEIVPMYTRCNKCWREKEDGAREPVTYYPGWGWAGPEDIEKYGDLIKGYGNR